MRDNIPYEKVRTLPMFRGVDDAVISSLIKASAAKLKRYGRQETVFVAHSAVRHVFVVMSGALKISEYGERGSAHILRVCRPGHIVGLAHILGFCRVCPHAICPHAIYRMNFVGIGSCGFAKMCTMSLEITQKCAQCS